jgi:tRNA(fMet)-specific endonuclease VapC
MYLLDTNICIYIINKHPRSVMKKVYDIDPGEIVISSVSVAELEYGASKSMQRDQNRTALRDFLSPFEIIPFSARDAEIYGILRADLERREELIGPYDMQLASQALARDLILVTNNTAEFNRINKLRLENWVN